MAGDFNDGLPPGRGVGNMLYTERTCTQTRYLKPLFLQVWDKKCIMWLGQNCNMQYVVVLCTISSTDGVEDLFPPFEIGLGSDLSPFESVDI